MLYLYSIVEILVVAFVVVYYETMVQNHYEVCCCEIAKSSPDLDSAYNHLIMKS